jgi:hypothetical protein
MKMKNETMGSLSESPALELTGSHSTVKAVILATLALWFGLICLLGIQGAFLGGVNSPPLPIFFGFAIPLAVFFAAYFKWGAFRNFVLGADLRFVAALQAWRWAGFGFISLYGYGVLPGLFAFPAGLGDMAVGFAAPWIVLGLVRNPSFATSRRFVTWNIMGIVDLVVAVSMGTLCSGFFHGITGSVTTGPMSQFPLVLIPAYFVPIFIMLHFAALAQVRRLAQAGTISLSVETLKR